LKEEKKKLKKKKEQSEQDGTTEKKKASKRSHAETGSEAAAAEAVDETPAAAASSSEAPVAAKRSKASTATEDVRWRILFTRMQQRCASLAGRPICAGCRRDGQCDARRGFEQLPACGCHAQCLEGGRLHVPLPYPIA
jgi:hypothetical protein